MPPCKFHALFSAHLPILLQQGLTLHSTCSPDLCIIRFNYLYIVTTKCSVLLDPALPLIIASSIIMFSSNKEHKLLGISASQFLHLNEFFVLTWWKLHLQWISLFQTWSPLLAPFQWITVLFHL